MANRFDDDPDCVALWKFEGIPNSSQLTADSIGTNTLTNNRGVPDGAFVKEGSSSIYFSPAATGWCTILDANLDIGFPFRYNDGANANKDITMGGWFHFLVTADATTHGFYLFQKDEGAGDRHTFEIVVNEHSRKLYINKGYNNGASFEVAIHASVIQKDVWYYIAVGYSERYGSYFMDIYDDNAGARLGSIAEGNFAQETSVRDNNFKINGGWANNPSYIDEYVVWKVRKSPGDMENVRAGTYSWQSFGNMSLNFNTLINFNGGG